MSRVVIIIGSIAVGFVATLSESSFKFTVGYYLATIAVELLLAKK